MISPEHPNYHSASDLLAAALEAQSHLATLIGELQSTNPPSISSISSRRPLLRSTQRLYRALQSPYEGCIDYFHQGYHHASLCAAIRLKILHHLGPLGGKGVSEVEVSEKTGQTTETVRRLLKILATDVGFVEEVDDGKWRRDKLGECSILAPASGLASIHGESIGWAVSSLGRFLEKNPVPKKHTDCTFSDLHDGKTLFEHVHDHPEIITGFTNCMEVFADTGSSVDIIKDFLQERNITSGTFKDVGGGTGHISQAIAYDFPEMSFEVQDVNPLMFANRSKSLPQNLRSRFNYVKQSFFDPQPIPSDSSSDNTSVVFLRWILHDWADPDCLTIIRHIVPVLERNPNAIMLINEFILPAWKEPGWEDPLDERPAREMDISMMSFLAAKERDLKMWKELFKQADERLEVTSMVREKKGMFPMGLLEVKLVR